MECYEGDFLDRGLRLEAEATKSQQNGDCVYSCYEIAVFLSNPVSKFPCQPSLPTSGSLSFPRIPTLASLNSLKQIKKLVRYRVCLVLSRMFQNIMLEYIFTAEKSLYCSYVFKG